MRTYDGPTQARHADPAQTEFAMVLFDFPSGYYGFWEGGQPLIWNTFTFKPGAQLIEIDAGAQTSAMEATTLTLRLYANPDAGLTANVLSTIEAEAYHQRPVTFYEACMNPDTLALVSVTPIWRGYVDQVRHEVDGRGRHLVGTLESRGLDYAKRGTAVASHAQQQLIYSGDLGMQYCGVVGAVEVPFGRKTPQRLAGAATSTTRPPL